MNMISAEAASPLLLEGARPAARQGRFRGICLMLLGRAVVGALE